MHLVLSEFHVSIIAQFAAHRLDGGLVLETSQDIQQLDRARIPVPLGRSLQKIRSLCILTNTMGKTRRRLNRRERAPRGPLKVAGNS